MEIYILLGFVLILSVYLGIEIISKVPSTLHTPVSYTHLTLPTNREV